MKERRIIALIALLMSLLIVFSSCAEKPSDVSVTTTATTEQEAVSSTQAAEEKPVSKYSINDKLIALTYDDGPSPTSTNRILDTLEKYNSVATFFVVGYNIENNISTIKRASDMGCEIGNHSLGHKNLMKCSDAEIRNQVETPNEMLKELAGIDVKLFRAPGGNFKDAEDEIGMPIIQWNIDTLDWKHKDASNKNRTEEQRNADLRKIADKVINNAQKGDIVLMHDIYGFTADLSELIIPALVEKGFTLVTVSEMYLAYGEELKDGKVYYNVDTTIASLEPVEPGDYRVKTNGGVLNVRAEADKNSESLVKIPNGTDIIVLRSVKGWAYVEYSGIRGWVNSAYIEKQ